MDKALEALERVLDLAEQVDSWESFPSGPLDEAQDALAAIRAALEASEPVGEPVAFLVERGSGEEKHSHLTWPDDETAWAASHFGGKVTPLYAAPPSTAEVMARALEDAANIFQMCHQPKVASELREMAKRRRSECHE